MFKSFFSDKFINKVADKITQAVNESLTSYQTKSDAKFDTIIEHVESLRIELKSLDNRLTTKEVRDKSEYGHVQYKLSSLQNEMLEKKKSIRKKAPDPDKLI